MKLLKRVLIIIITIILSLILVFNIYNFICLKIMHKDLATINGYALLEVVSGSMEPTIKVGDMIIIDTKAKDYQKGDIVTFYDINNAFVTHRIIEIDGKEMVTKGDNKANSIDDPTSVDKIVGKHIYTLGKLGILITSLKSPLVMFMILVIGIIICYLISTDKEGKPILENEEVEFQEFVDNKEELKEELAKKIQETALLKEKRLKKANKKEVKSKKKKKRKKTKKHTAKKKAK